MRKGEVWFVEFPLEEDASRIINRPVIVLDENVLGVLSVKITKHKVRKEDPYDIPIIYWSEAGLRLASTARVSKVTVLNKDSFIFKIGNLHNDDMDRIEAMYSKFLEDNNIKYNKTSHMMSFPIKDAGVSYGWFYKVEQ